MGIFKRILELYRPEQNGCYQSSLAFSEVSRPNITSRATIVVIGNRCNLEPIPYRIGIYI
jgi:hypothetical protein